MTWISKHWLSLKILKILVWIIVGSVSVSSTGQSEFSVVIIGKWNGENLKEDQVYTTENGQWFRFSTVKFYMNSLEVISADGQIIKDAKKHRLTDLLLPNQEKIVFSLEQDFVPDSLLFWVGVDSLTQSAGALGLDLDPSHGMYWTWQSGYIHVKIEGNSSGSSHPKQEFAYHLGGFRSPFNSIRKVALDVNTFKNGVVVGLDLAHFVSQLDLSANHHIMSPSGISSELACAFASCFQIRVP